MFATKHPICRKAIRPCAALALAASALFTQRLHAAVPEIVSEDGRADASYVPAMLSNGRLNVFCDYTLSVPGETPAYVKKNLRPGVWWEGRRYGDNNGRAGRFGYQFFPQGRPTTVIAVDGVRQTAPRTWRQRLDLRQAVSTVASEYTGDIRFEGEMFVPRSDNVIAIRQTVTAGKEAHEVTFGLAYQAPRAERLVGNWRVEGPAAVWRMTAYARFVTHETITVRPASPDAALTPQVVRGDAELVETVRLAPGESKTLTWYVAYEDDLDAKLPAVTPAPKRSGPLPDYETLRRAHADDWAAYFAESEIDVPDGRILAMSDMARYHLRCNATEWSIPVGVIQSHWQGRIFAFDEMYGVQGLLSAGHFATARVAPDFRFATLTNACIRNNKNPDRPFYDHGARWVWEAAEGNDVESGPIGYWNGHIFHSAAVAQTVWSYYRYTDDLDYLRQKGYDVIRECALFFRRLRVHDAPDGTSFVTKCTDLERMGPGKDHPFMTTCGVIMTLRAAADAADLLGKDADLAADFRACADRLVASLPEAGGRYVAYPGCKDESMGTLAGFYPFQVFGRDNVRQVAAVRHFLENGQAFGNMYDTGKRICPWYAATMAMASLRAGDTRHPPIRWLQEAARSAGCWGEYWEINEPGVSEFRPWFMTAAGNCLYAINQLFVTERDGALHLAAGVPADWRDYSFRLPAPGGVTVEMKVRDGKLAHLDVKTRHPGRPKPKVVLPAGLSAPQDARPVPVVAFTLGNGVPGPCKQQVFTTERMKCRESDDTVTWTGGPFGGEAFKVTAVRTHQGASEAWDVSWSGFASTSFVESVALSFVVPRVGAASVLVPHVPGWILRPDWAQVKPNASLHGGTMNGCKVQCVFNEGAPSWTCELRGARFEPVSFNLRVGPTTDTVRMRYSYEMPVSRATTASYRLPFLTVLTPFEGGWFQAAEIYRRGVWTTDWYRKSRARDFGRLRDVGMWFWNRRTSDIVIPPVERFQADAGVPVALDWYWWHRTSYDTGYPNFWPPREKEADFRAAVRRLNEKGIYCQTYMNGMTWDVDDPSWTEGGSEGVKILRDGTFRAHPWNRFTGHRLGYMCGEAPKHQARMREQVRILRGCGFDGQYLDMIGNASYGACWNTNHTHALGGGDHMVRGFRAFVESVRRENPGMDLSTEDINEAYMDLFESVIALGPSYERTSGVAGEIRRESVPFAQAVYHRAVVMFGTFSMLDGIPAFDPLWPAEEKWKDEKPWERLFPDQFQVELSRCVVWGQQPCVHNFRLNNATDPRYRDGYRFMIDTARFYHANRDWLFDGEMCDPGQLACADQKVEFLQRATYTKAGEYKVAVHVLPTVFHSVWKAPDGRIAAFLVNWSRQPQRYALKTPDLAAEGELPPRSWRKAESR